MISKTSRRKKIILFLMVFYFFFILTFNFIPSFNNDNLVKAWSIEYSPVSSETGQLQKGYAAGWDNVHDSASADAENTGISSIGVFKSAGQYAIGRYVLFYNTSDLPNDITINNVILRSPTLTSNTGTNGFYVVNGNNANEIMELTDYNYNLWGEQYCYDTITGTATHDFVFDQNLSTSINTTGWSTFYFVHKKDYEDTAPTSSEYIQAQPDSFKLIIIYTETFEEEDPYDTCFIGDLTKNIGENTQLKFKFFEFRYANEFDGIITRVDIPISINQWNYHNVSNDYYLSVNGVVYSNPIVSDFVYQWHGNQKAHKLLSWTNLNIDNTANRVKGARVVNIAIGYKISGSWSTWQYMLFSDEEVHGDNYELIRVHADEILFAYDFQDGTSYNGWEFPFRFWFNCYEVDPSDLIYNFDSDTVFISPAENGSLEFYVGDSVNYIVYSETMETQPYIHINKDGSNIQIIKMIGQPESRTYVPLSDGSYNITLVRGGIWRAGVNFTVYPITYENYIYTVPPKSYPFQKVRAYYNYTQGDGYDGKIVISTSNNFFDTQGYLTSFYISVNTTGFKDVGQLFSSERNYYIYLCVVYPNNRSFQVATKTHPCFFETSNSLTGKYDEVFIDKAGFDYQVFQYSHNYVLWKVVIKINNVVHYQVGDRNKGEITHYETIQGFRNSTLELLTNEGYITLDYFGYYAKKYGHDIPPESDQITYVIDLYFAPEFQFLLGIGIILISAFAPLMIAQKLKVKNLPNLLYLLCAVVGFAICIYFELFDLYTIIIFGFVFSSLIVWNILGQMGMLGGSTQTGLTEEGEIEAKPRTIQKWTGKVKSYRTEKAKRRK